VSQGAGRPGAKGSGPGPESGPGIVDRGSWAVHGDMEAVETVRRVDLRTMSGNLFETEAAPEEAGGWYVAHCDGGSRGNPGPAGYGAVVEDPEGLVVARLSEYLGRQTNNFAEYKGLLAVLDWALANGARRLRVVSDSELMVRQMKGRYKVKSPGLRPLWEEAQRLALKLKGFDMRHTLRGENKEADRLANEAMDEGMKQRG
jgi:ribonuclease HI